MDSIKSHSDKALQLNGRHRVMVSLWFAFLSTVGVYVLLSLFIPAPNSDSAQSRVITFVLTAIGIFLVIISLTVKQKFMTAAEEKQSMGQVQSGLVVALALCDAAAVLGLLDHLLTGNHYYFVMFIVASIGMLLNFPRRSELTRASYRRPNEINQN